jgi:hypothetical protein
MIALRKPCRIKSGEAFGAGKLKRPTSISRCGQRPLHARVQTLRSNR